MSKSGRKSPGKSGPAVDAGKPAAAGYRVLARKYRPHTFAGLIGQDVMVKTLENAFRTGRIAQAYMLTGVRGVGKTTTARLIARALNYGTGDGAPTSLDMPEMGEHCAAILESRHIDVLEMDAASNTGIDDVREIIEAVRYKPASARYKVYIIDEVHMLSRQAFNGLLKTLEEPPAHVKFIFATTEVRKVPVTVLSRCQRFDLRRVDGPTLSAHLRSVASQESVALDDDALAQIVRASQGSVRDALSLLDQAIAHDGETVSGEIVRAMLGLSDRGRILDLFEHVMTGDVAAALGVLDEQHTAGADPLAVLGDLAEFVHWVTRLKVVESSSDDPSYSHEERIRAAALAERLAMPVLARCWQMLLKGLGEVQAAPDPAAAADMVIIRLAHVSNLPTPGDLVRALEPDTRRGGDTSAGAPPVEGAGPRAASLPPAPAVSGSDPAGGPSAALRRDPLPAPERETVSAAPAATPIRPLECFGDVVALARDMRDIQLTNALEHHVRPVDFGRGRICIHLVDGAPGTLANRLGARLQDWTGERWVITVASEPPGGDVLTIADQRKRDQDMLIAEARKDPLVAAALRIFPGAEITGVRDLGDEAAPDTPDRSTNGDEKP